ncbi:hypothetical protein QOZ80_3AG0216730 [Eleusine coracana subsp. coracana]|nr:hypothetical protein QOZ80_3AG0216730 [Eleusine coracana subsp. coracana]
MATSSASTEQQGRRRIVRVLLVEDEAIHQVIARQLLKAVGGVELDVAVNGAEAVRRVQERGAYYYDLILTDRQMPVMDGHEVISDRVGALVFLFTASIESLCSAFRPFVGT